MKVVHKSHPPFEVVKQIREEFSSPDFSQRNIGLGENPTSEEKFKYEICQSIARYQRENNFSLIELEERMKIKTEHLNDILYGRINKLNLNELVAYLEELHFPFQVRIINQSEGNKNRTWR